MRPPELDPETEAWLDRLVDEAPPLSPAQEAIISAAFESEASDGP
ncbi:hypothetical protein [Mycolicibacterium septicum]|nr:hypothetical protein [Mycolicibacterium septicum]